MVNSPIMSPSSVTGGKSPGRYHFSEVNAKAAPFVYGTPIRKNYKTWPFVIVALSALAVVATYVLHQLPQYRLHLRYDLYRMFGATTDPDTGEWSATGHREVVNLVVLFACVSLPTLVGGLALGMGNALPPVPKGIYRTYTRFLKRKILVSHVNISYAEGFCCLLFLGLNAVWFAAAFPRRVTSQTDPETKISAEPAFTSVGYVLGLNAVLCFSFLILPATRNCFWMISMGIDYSHSIRYHRWIGFLTVFLVVAHAVPYYVEWLKAGTFVEKSLPCFSDSLDSKGNVKKCDLASNRGRFQNFFGQIALLCIVIIGITSLNPIRRRFYEVFYYSHYLFIVVLITSCLHFSEFVIWMHPAICLYVMHRMLANMQSRVPCEVVDLEAIPGQITRLVFRRSPGSAGHYHAGQFVYLRIPLLSGTQWHPYSISSSPIEYEDTFTVHVKAIGGWSKALFGVAIQAREERKMPLIYVDGFYGKMSDDFQHYPALVMVAGGIGGTPIVSIVGKILDCMRNNETAMANTQVYFHWTSREIGIFHEFEPLLDAIEQFDPQRRIFKVRLCFTGDQHLGGVDIPNGISLKPMDDTSMVPTRPFFQASRSIPRQMGLFVVIFTASFAALFFVRFNYPLYGENRANQNMWLLQRLAELFAVLGGAALGWFVAMSETKPRSLSRIEKSMLMDGGGGEYSIIEDDYDDEERDSVYSHTLSFDGQEVEFHHPVSRARLDVKTLFADVVREQSHNFEVSAAGIGTWVSGPMGLIHAVESEAAKFAGIFDVHYEEFEL